MMLSACANVSELTCFVANDSSNNCSRESDLSFSEDSSADNSSTSEGKPDTESDVSCDSVELRSKPRILEKRVSFPTDESLLVRNLEPTVPETCPEAVMPAAPAGFNLANAYIASCQKNVTKPLDVILEQLKTLDLACPRSASLTLRGLSLESTDCESLEDVLKSVPLKLLDLSSSHCNDEGLIALFDMIEFYEAASHVSIAANKSMSNRGWQACCRMIKRTECLEWLDAAQIGLSEHSSTFLARALRSNSRLRVLLLNGCSLSGRPLAIIASSLKMNRNLRELYIAENKLNAFDALQLGILLTGNKTLQLVDLKNNEIGDKGMMYLCDALLDNTGLTTLIAWNNKITQAASPGLARALAENKTLETFNLGYNPLKDDGLIGFLPSGLERNRTLLHLGLQQTGLTCSAIISLAEYLASGTGLKRVDLRKNEVNLAGLMALVAALKHCPSVIRLDLLNITPPSDHDAAEFQRLEKEIAELCELNKGAIEAQTQSNAEDELKPLPHIGTFAAEALIGRKTSLTCASPPNERLLHLPLLRTEEEDESAQPEEQKEKEHRKLRSPLPSPSPSPLPSPSGRFRVTKVETSADEFFPNPSPLPSPRSRFTVIPVVAPAEKPQDPSSDDKSSDSTSLIRSSPSKVIFGFDVVST